MLVVFLFSSTFRPALPFPGSLWIVLGSQHISVAWSRLLRALFYNLSYFSKGGKSCLHKSFSVSKYHLPRKPFTKSVFSLWYWMVSWHMIYIVFIYSQKKCFLLSLSFLMVTLSGCLSDLVRLWVHLFPPRLKWSSSMYMFV